MKRLLNFCGVVGLTCILAFVLVHFTTASPLPAPLEAGSITADTVAARAITTTGDIVISAPTNGGNAGAKNELTGLPRVQMVALGAMTNGSTETTSYTDDSSAGEYAPIDESVTEAEGSTDGIYRIGASSYKAIFASTAITDDGFTRNITSDDLQNNESIGAWLYPTATIAEGDLSLRLTDDGGVRTGITNTVALPANKWTWVEFDISALDGTTGNAVSTFGVVLTAEGAANLGAFSLYMDGVWKWDADDEEALGVGVLPDGVLSVMTIATAAATANTPATLVENTGYFVHYEDGNDFLVTVTNQSANSGLALIAY